MVSGRVQPHDTLTAAAKTKWWYIVRSTPQLMLATVQLLVAETEKLLWKSSVRLSAMRKKSPRKPKVIHSSQVPPDKISMSNFGVAPSQAEEENKFFQLQRKLLLMLE